MWEKRVFLINEITLCDPSIKRDVKRVQEGTLVPIYKNKDVQNCENYRGIELMRP